jgi:hypothetical protein
MSSANIACVGLLGLSAWVDTGDPARVSFPLGVLYPYSSDLQCVCICFDAMLEEWPAAALMLTSAPHTAQPAVSPGATAATTAFLESIAALYGRIAFAGPAATSLARAYAHLSEGLAHTGRLQNSAAATRLRSRRDISAPQPPVQSPTSARVGA